MVKKSTQVELTLQANSLTLQHSLQDDVPTRRHSIASTWLRGVMDALAGSGLDVDAVCREVGIDHAAVASGAAGCSTEQLSLLWEVAARRSRNPAIGLVAGRAANPASFDVVGYAMMSSATLLDGLDRLRRYLRLVADDHALHIRRVGTSVRLTFVIGGGTRPVPPARYDSIFLTLQNFCQWMTGRPLKFQRLELSHDAPKDLRPYQRVFGCPICFGVRENSVIFAADDLAAPLPTANPILIDMLDALAGKKLREMDQTSVRQRVIERIRRTLPDGEPGRAAIAGALNISERTLQRQLSEEGTSYQQLLDQTRRELAEQYLAQAHVSLGEVAYLMGFAEPSIFTRACKRWFQAAPGQVRARLLER